MNKPKGNHPGESEDLHLRIQQPSAEVKAGRHDQYFFYGGKVGGNEEMDYLNGEKAEKKPGGAIKNRESQERGHDPLFIPLGACEIDKRYTGCKNERQQDQQHVEKDEGNEAGSEALF